jgi:hypothetical protein
MAIGTRAGTWSANTPAKKMLNDITRVTIIMSVAKTRPRNESGTSICRA